MPITRSQMRRQLRRSGGIMDVTPRENFGIGSSLKKFTRKIIPNEIADIAVKAAPFVAPFNPAAAAAMAGIGGFDQTGSIGDSLKSAALTYGGGQLARYASGAGFQQNPFTQGGAFRGGLEGFKAGFTSPFGTETGIGKMLSDKAAAKGKALKVEGITGIDESITADAAPVKSAIVDSSITADAPAVVSELTSKSVIKNDPSIFNLVKEGDYGKALVEGAKKFGKAVFTKDDGSLDKTALLAAGAFGLTYLDALRIANEAGEELPREEYDEAAKAEFKEKYHGYLQNFFGGKADGGRIGFAKGSIDNDSEDIKKLKKLISGDIIENEKPDMSDMDDLMAGTGINFSRQEKSYLFKRLGGSGGADRSYTMPNLYRILNNPGRYPEDARVLKEIAIMGLNKKDGGRIGFESGANKQIAIENAMSELRKKYPELSEENLFSLVLNGFGAKSDEKELPAPSIKIDNNIDNLPRGLQIDTTTSNPIPENAPNMAAADIAKVIMGTLGDGEDMSSRKFIFESYVIPKRKDLMENFGYNLQEADNLIREEMNKLRDNREIGGRIGYAGGTSITDYAKKMNSGNGPITRKDYIDIYLFAGYEPDVANSLGTKHYKTGMGQDQNTLGFALGGEVPVRKNEGGVMELDYRDTGGFVPIGIKERADDVPAMLSKNEFVLTADAVRGIGNGDVEKGAETLYGIMKQAEKVGQA